MNVLVSEVTRELSVREEELLKRLEGDIRTNLAGFKIVGAALATIKEQQLYRKYYDTFEEYCLNEWDMVRRRAYQLVDASEVINNLCTMVHTKSNPWATNEEWDPRVPLLPLNERQARPLTAIPMEQQGEVWAMVLEDSEKDGVKITASYIQQRVDIYLNKKVREKVQQANRKSQQLSLFPESIQIYFSAFMESLHSELDEPLDKGCKKEMVRMLEEILVTVKNR